MVSTSGKIETHLIFNALQNSCQVTDKSQRRGWFLLNLKQWKRRAKLVAMSAFFCSVLTFWNVIQGNIMYHIHVLVLTATVWSRYSHYFGLLKIRNGSEKKEQFFSITVSEVIGNRFSIVELLISDLCNAKIYLSVKEVKDQCSFLVAMSFWLFTTR